jgi:hypothetical protein
MIESPTAHLLAATLHIFIWTPSELSMAGMSSPPEERSDRLTLFSIDLLTQELSYPMIAYNNTYGIQTINETVYKQAVNDFSKPGGCKDLIVKCRSMAAKLDPLDYGNNPKVNAACQDADNFCSNNVEGPYIEYSGVSYSLPDILPMY